MSRKHKIIISITGIFLVLLILVGLTYGYFLTRIKGNTNPKSISGKIANLSLVYGGDNGSIIGEGEVIIPGTTFDSKTFTVKNTGNAKTDYAVVIENVSVTYAETIEVDGVTQTAGSTTTFASNDFAYTLTCTSGCNGVDKETTFPIEGGILVGNSIDVGKTQTYVFTLTYLETGVDQSADMNKTMTARINIKDISTTNPYSGDTSSLAYNIINNAIGLTEQEKEAFYAELVATPPTKVGTQISSPGLIYTKAEDPTTFSSSYDAKSTYYYVYADDYTVDKQTGKIKLVNPQVGQYSSIYPHLSGKYITDYWGYSSQSTASNYAAEGKTFSSIYKVSTKTSDVTSTSFQYARLTTERKRPESVISVTQDEYGTSYYYRGAVKNNYLSFNNMCWRIVRIEGDGAIKIVLADATAECSTATLAKTDSAYIGTGDYGYTTNSNSQYFADYENSANRTSSMKYKFNEWFNTNLTSVSSKLKTTTACIGDTTTKYNDNGNILTDTAATELGRWYYKNYVRLAKNKYATLMCEGKKTSETKISPLTADEVVFAGGKRGDSNYTYYLIENATTNDWWTLSLGSFYVGRDLAFSVYYEGKADVHSVNTVGSLRPTVSLVSGVKIAKGDGSISNPYTIQ